MPRTFEGELLITRKGLDDRPTRALFVAGLENTPYLFKPELTECMGNEVRYSGLEKHEGAWVLQEWNVEILRL